MKVLTVKQPWAWLICAGLKDVENRPRRTSHRGPILILASKKPVSSDEWRDALAFCTARGIKLPQQKTLAHGGIVGMVEITGCVSRSNSPCFVGPWGYTLRNARELPFVPLRGQLAMFNAPEHALRALRLPVDSRPLRVP